jgi:hypothetical protein
MNEPITGIVHVHSDFSRDGLCSVRELASYARDEGLRFVTLTDHAEEISLDDMKKLQQQCAQESDESCVLIPGLEFRCSGDIHILGLGISREIPCEDPVTVATQIGAMGGLAILAHPARNGYQCHPELCRVLDGIEIWNAAYDGPFVPPLANMDLLQKARDANQAISGFGGADLHWLDGPPGVTIELRVKGPSPLNPSIQMVMDCLRTGSFAVRGRYVALDVQVLPNWPTRSLLRVFRTFYEVATGMRNVVMGGLEEHTE